MRTRNLFLILTTLLLVACSKNKEKDETYLELNNKDLEREIIKYDKFIDSICSKSYVLQVNCIEKDDSITRYVIGAIDGTDILDMFPYHFICRINNKDVFFTMRSGLVYFGKKQNFFNLKSNEIERVMKKYFPEEYSEHLKNVEKEKKGELTTVTMTIFEPEMYYLTFNRNKLINKEIKRGMPDDFIPIDIELEKQRVKEVAKRNSLHKIWLKQIQHK
jgi:RNA binding exosome subunit